MLNRHTTQAGVSWATTPSTKSRPSAPSTTGKRDRISKTWLLVAALTLREEKGGMKLRVVVENELIGEKDRPKSPDVYLSFSLAHIMLQS